MGNQIGYEQYRSPRLLINWVRQPGEEDQEVVLDISKIFQNVSRYSSTKACGAYQQNAHVVRVYETLKQETVLYMPSMLVTNELALAIMYSFMDWKLTTF